MNKDWKWDTIFLSILTNNFTSITLLLGLGLRLKFFNTTISAVLRQPWLSWECGKILWLLASVLISNAGSVLIFNLLGDGKYWYNPLPRQHIRMLLVSLFYSDVAKVTGYIIVISLPGVVLHIGIGLCPTPMCKTTRDITITSNSKVIAVTTTNKQE